MQSCPIPAATDADWAANNRIEPSKIRLTQIISSHMVWNLSKLRQRSRESWWPLAPALLSEFDRRLEALGPSTRRRKQSELSAHFDNDPIRYCKPEP